MLPFLTTNAAGDILSARQEIESLIETSQITDARIHIEQIKADYSMDSDLPEALYKIGRRYEWSERYNEARRLYEQIIRDYSDSPSAGNARLGLARERVLSLIISGEYSRAQEAVDTLISDFSSDPCLPDSLYWIAERYRWSHQWEKANSIYGQIRTGYPGTVAASRANLGLARAKVLSLLVAEDYIASDKALDKLLVDFAGHPDLPETLYWIAEGYRWGGKYEKAKKLHQQIIQNCPDSSYSSKAALGLARASTLSLIISRDYDKAEIVLDKLISDFSGHPDLPDTLYWIAKSYRWSDRYEKSKELFKRIIEEYPQNSAAGKARQQFQVVVEGIDVFALIESGREQEAQDAINKLIANPAENENDEISAYTVFLCGDRYYAKGLQKTEQGLKDEAATNFIKAIDIWGQMIQQLPSSKSKALAYYRSANCYVGLGQYDQAVEKYTQLLENYPGYSLAWDARFKIGRCYQRLKDNNTIDKSSADAKTKAAYEVVLKEYPNCPAAKAAEDWVKKHAK
jgi:TolA-binding protein